jgi:predicted acylesterase/phospholipase RssA
MTDEETWQAIRASAAIPGLFPPVKLWKEVFVDGGIVLNTPIRPAVDEGASEIHTISLNPKMTKLPVTHIENTLDTFSRVYSAMLASKIAEDIESARWVNDWLEVLERLDAGEDLNSETMRRFVRVAGKISRQLRADGKLPLKVTVHRYYPRRSMGGLLGMLNFERASIDAMIEEGYTDTCKHHCGVNNCVIPAVVHRPESEWIAAASVS